MVRYINFTLSCAWRSTTSNAFMSSTSLRKSRSWRSKSTRRRISSCSNSLKFNFLAAAVPAAVGRKEGTVAAVEVAAVDEAGAGPPAVVAALLVPTMPMADVVVGATVVSRNFLLPSRFNSYIRYSIS